MSNRRTIVLSASSISTFKACPYRYFLRYVKGFVPIEEKTALRYGSAWHRVLEILSMQPGDVCPDCAKTQPNKDCPICQGTDAIPTDPMTAASRALTAVYVEKVGMDPERAELEQVQILYAATMYRHLYADQAIPVVEREIRFRLPLTGHGGRALPDVRVDGMIDKLVQPGESLSVMEHKSTSKGVEADSTFWSHLALDTQTHMYPWAASQITGRPVRGVFYDAFHKPGISPKTLTQALSAEFVASGEYCGQKFDVATCGNVTVNGVPAACEPGKKEGTFAIKETAQMYGARLMQDIAERPEFYFARREIARTDADIARFEKQLLNIYHTMRSMERDDAWYQNESQCEATFKCDFCNLCYNNAVITDEIPEGFKSLFTKEIPDADATTDATEKNSTSAAE